MHSTDTARTTHGAVTKSRQTDKKKSTMHVKGTRIENRPNVYLCLLYEERSRYCYHCRKRIEFILFPMHAHKVWLTHVPKPKQTHK